MRNGKFTYTQMFGLVHPTKTEVPTVPELRYSTILDKDQLDTHLLYFILQYAYYNPLHVRLSFARVERERSSLSTSEPDSHLPRVTIPDAASIQFSLLMMSI